MHHYTYLSAAEHNKIAKMYVRHYSPNSIAKASDKRQLQRKPQA